MKYHFRFLTRIALLCLFASILPAQNTELDEYRAASAIPQMEKKTEALKQYLSRFPDGKYTGRAYNDLFRIAVNSNAVSDALFYADKYLGTIPESARMNPYNSVAYTLAEKKIGLDSAAVYAQRAVDLAQKSSKRALRQILDTQALIFFERGYPDSALTRQREAIIGNETDPGYLYFLAVYEHATGLHQDALIHAAQAVLHGDRGNSLAKFREWIRLARSTESEQEEYLSSITKRVAEEFLKETDSASMGQNRSAAGVFLATMNVDLQRAETLSMEAIAGITDAMPLDKMISLTTNHAFIQSAVGKETKALESLLSVRTLVSPYDGDYWLILGGLYEKKNEFEKAIESYVQGLLAFENPKVKAAADSLLRRTMSGPASLSDAITRAKEELINFHPGKNSRRNVTGRTVLAELFTGAECNPCVASDHAFDQLAEYYTRADLAILEYHLHIPGPDPMTNPDTYRRYQFYGSDFGTPTVFIDGREKLVGGGGSINAANRFRVYDHLISKYQQKKPLVSITGRATLKGDVVKTSLTVSSASVITKNTLKIHIALAEKSIAYVGANGVSKHIFVVRDLVHGADGTPLMTGKKKTEHTVVIDVNDVQKGIAAYLDDPTTDPSWRGTFTGWRERTDTIDRSKLAVVAWVQDNETKEVVQSIYMDVEPHAGKK